MAYLQPVIDKITTLEISIISTAFRGYIYYPPFTIQLVSDWTYQTPGIIIVNFTFPSDMLSPSSIKMQYSYLRLTNFAEDYEFVSINFELLRTIGITIQPGAQCNLPLVFQAQNFTNWYE